MYMIMINILSILFNHIKSIYCKQDLCTTYQYFIHNNFEVTNIKLFSSLQLIISINKNITAFLTMLEG
jgi:hypothetical protein